jgi:hypothetical protein
MLLVIFGAGASFDSVPHLPPRSTPFELDRPPLANELFANRPTFVDAMDQFPDCKALVPLLRKDGVMIEKELASFREQGKSFPQRYRQLASIQYYLHFVLSTCQQVWAGRHRGITNYATFLDSIECWRYQYSERVCFVTFNYDTILEVAMSQVLGLQVADMSSYISWPNYSLVKMHGSVNWGREVENVPSHPHGLYPQFLIDYAGSIKISDRYRLVQRRPMIEDGGVPVFPALSIPVENKDEFSCPKSHVQALSNCLPEVTKIVTIGWRATEADFLSMLRHEIASTPDLFVVSGDKGGAEQTVKNLVSPPLKVRAAQSVATGFTGLILENLGLLKAFLQASPL